MEAELIVRSVIFVTFAAAVGAALGLATSSSERGEAFRAFVSAELAPVARMTTAHRDGELMSNAGQAVESIAPYYAKFFPDGKPDSDMKACVQREQPTNSAQFTEEMFGLPVHHAVTTVIGCLLDHDLQRFCRPGGREQIAAAGEIYFWARHRTLADLEQRKAKGQYVDAGDRKTYRDTSGPHYDQYALSWDGPDDRAIVANLKLLARQGYVSLADFGFLPRDEIRAALDGVTVEKDACGKT
jgi:hypothetical protein